VAEKGDTLVGYAEARRGEVGAHIGRLAVLPRCQEQGIGARLLRDTLTQLWSQGVFRITLNTQESNLSSQRLYLRFGFRPFGERIAVWERVL
jgi:ribosomal-protein-alanine N-acetyltransferase